MSTEYYNPWLRLFEVTEPDNPTVPVVELARDIARAQTTYPLYRAQFPDKASSIDAEYHRNLMSLRSELEKEIAARLLSEIRPPGGRERKESHERAGKGAMYVGPADFERK